MCLCAHTHAPGCQKRLRSDGGRQLIIKAEERKKRKKERKKKEKREKDGRQRKRGAVKLSVTCQFLSPNNVYPPASFFFFFFHLPSIVVQSLPASTAKSESRPPPLEEIGDAIFCLAFASLLQQLDMLGRANVPNQSGSCSDSNSGNARRRLHGTLDLTRQSWPPTSSTRNSKSIRAIVT